MVATSYAQPRAMSSSKLAELARPLHPHVHAAEPLVDAVALAKAAASPDGTVVVAGSLMLVGEARALWCDGPVDELVVTDPGPPSTNP